MANLSFDYSKWDNIEDSEDEADLHPNIDKDSWFRLKHRMRVEREDDESKEKKDLQAALKKDKDALAQFGSAGQEHTKAKKLKAEIQKKEDRLDYMEKHKKWSVDSMCHVTEDYSHVNSRIEEPRAEKGHVSGPVVKDMDTDGYVTFVEENEDILEKYIGMADESNEKICEFLQEHGEKFIHSEHAESYLLLDCLEKEMNGHHREMKQSAKMRQMITQIKE